MHTPALSEAAQLASERLRHTREALMRHMVHSEGAARPRAATASGTTPPPEGPAGRLAHDGHASGSDEAGRSAPASPQDAGDDGEGLGSVWRELRDSASDWWHTHPAHLAVEVARPLFEKYARAHPVRVLALSAATGAAVVLARPWRLISATGLLMAVVKSTQMSQLAASMLRPRDAEALRRHETERARQAERQAWQQAQAEARARDRALH